MAWARFGADYDFRVEHHTTIAYRAGMRCSVVRACLEGAVAAGAAAEIRTPTSAVRAALEADPFWRAESEYVAHGQRAS